MLQLLKKVNELWVERTVKEEDNLCKNYRLAFDIGQGNAQIESVLEAVINGR